MTIHVVPTDGTRLSNSSRLNQARLSFYRGDSFACVGTGQTGLSDCAAISLRFTCTVVPREAVSPLPGVQISRKAIRKTRKEEGGE